MPVNHSPRIASSQVPDFVLASRAAEEKTKETALSRLLRDRVVERAARTTVLDAEEGMASEESCREDPTKLGTQEEHGVDYSVGYQVQPSERDVCEEVQGGGLGAAGHSGSHRHTERGRRIPPPEGG
ncbi:jg9161 [Pararge aegeria aegeria]|uniref:Jg9161 protein n=1 Tax=Pararge aegeria aegeria TaxID=348720 RepID=A0A8S4QWX6_9NEOP|nr:jg9161 [Pararge aegeria aegeria]